MNSLNTNRNNFSSLLPSENKVLSVIKRHKQTNRDVSYITNTHSREKMKTLDITQRDVIKSIEECDKFYDNERWTVVEKRLSDHIIRTVFNIHDRNNVHIVTTMYINEKKFSENRVDSLI